MSIAELIKQLEKATAPDRWIDARIDALFRIGPEKLRTSGYEWAWENFPNWAPHKQARGMCGVMHNNGELGLIWDSLEFTSDIRAGLTLLKHVLPGWHWKCGSTPLFLSGWAQVSSSFSMDLSVKDSASAADGLGTSPAIALCIAILKAKEAMSA